MAVPAQCLVFPLPASVLLIIGNRASLVIDGGGKPSVLAIFSHNELLASGTVPVPPLKGGIRRGSLVIGNDEPGERKRRDFGSRRHFWFGGGDLTA